MATRIDAQQQSAKEVDFDIRDPPTTPIVPAGTVPVCSQQSDINAQDYPGARDPFGPTTPKIQADSIWRHGQFEFY